MVIQCTCSCAEHYNDRMIDSSQCSHFHMLFTLRLPTVFTLGWDTVDLLHSKHLAGEIKIRSHLVRMCTCRCLKCESSCEFLPSSCSFSPFSRSISSFSRSIRLFSLPFSCCMAISAVSFPVQVFCILEIVVLIVIAAMS